MYYEFPIISVTRRIAAWGAFSLSLLYLSVSSVVAEQRVKLVVNGHEIAASVANTYTLRKKGLMNRRSLAENEGMLFVFPKADYYSMWMKNTLIPLSVAFIDQNGVIINIEEMTALSLDQHTAQKPAKYAVEMNAGWFYRHEAKTGDPVRGLDNADKTP